MKYSKLPISISVQIENLKNRGLSFGDETKAAHYLSNISYYRLRAYTYPFQDNSNSNHPFTTNISFEEIVDLYVFDRRLRLLIFNAIEKIEISLRTQIIYQFALTYGSHWHTTKLLYNDPLLFKNHLASLKKEINRSKETFIDHYKNTYTNPKTPPSWMSLEISSLGLLSKLFTNLKNHNCKDEVARHFGIKDVNTLENWMLCLNILRNICAHHGRVWNRRMTQITILKKPIYPYISNKNILSYKVYAYIVQIQYMLNIISPNNEFKKNLLNLMKTCPLVQDKAMGFPEDWENEPIWK